MNDIQFKEFLTQLGALFDSKENKEIQELKEKIQILENDRIESLVLNKEVKMRLDSLTDDMKEIKDYIREQREQPEKDKKDFIKQVISTIISLSIGALFGYLTNKK